MCHLPRRFRHREHPEGPCALRATLGVSWAAWLTLVAGCTASGHPDFVKFSPDGRRLVYQDARHDRVYVYDLEARQRYAIPGCVACMDREVKRLVLLPRRYRGDKPIADPAPCTLVMITDGKPSLEPLPPLHAGTGYRRVFVEFEPEQTSLLAIIYATSDALKPEFCRRLALAGDRWLDVELPEARRDALPGRLLVPAGTREGGHCYSPVSEPGVVPSGEELGVGVETESRKDSLTYVLRSPDSKYVVRISDGADAWRRMTLTGPGTMNKEIILDKDDAAYDVFDGCVRIMELPVRVFMPNF
jgi:hypothetical protein